MILKDSWEIFYLSNFFFQFKENYFFAPLNYQTNPLAELRKISSFPWENYMQFAKKVNLILWKQKSLIIF